MIKLVFDNIIYSWQTHGGISVVWTELLRRLSLRPNIDCTYIEYPGCMNNITRKELCLPDGHILHRKPICLIFSRYFSPSFDSNEPFIFHSSYYRTCNNPQAINITIVHDFTYEFFTNGIKKWTHCLQKHKAIRNSDYIICISQNTKKDLLRFFPNIDEKRVRVIYNGISSDFYHIKNCEVSTKNVLFVGARSGYKNFDAAVNALSGTEYRLVICGSPLTNKEEKLLTKKLKADQYEVHQRVSINKLRELYNQAYCTLYPSSYEGFGLPVLEAQQCGCPVIAYNASSIPEIIGNTSLLLNTLNADEIREKLNMLKDSSLRQTIIQDGYENTKRFSWDTMAQQYEQLYYEALNTANQNENNTNNSHIQ